MDGFLEPSKLKTYRRNKMTDGINLDGFTANRREAGTNGINASGQYSPATGSFPAAQDKSTQDGAGVGNGGK